MKGKSSGERAKRPAAARALAPEDQSLFLTAMGGVTPLGARDRLPLPPPPPAPVRVVELPPTAALTVEGDGQRFAGRAAGVSHAQVSELRAGKIHAEVTLDLHGSTIEPARAQLRRFLYEARQLGRRCVRIIHGRGLHSEPGLGAHRAPLREAVLEELLGPLSGLVHAFASAAPADGGDGATYVMLRGGR